MGFVRDVVSTFLILSFLAFFYFVFFFKKILTKKQQKNILGHFEQFLVKRPNTAK
jgi:hypothetical protein